MNKHKLNKTVIIKVIEYSNIHIYLHARVCSKYIAFAGKTLKEANVSCKKYV